MIFFLVLACQTVTDTADIPYCEEPPLYTDWTEGFLKGKCQPCHGINSPNRYGAPANVYFDSEEASLYWIDAIERSVLESESMPPNGGVTEDDKALLRLWLDCY